MTLGRPNHLVHFRIASSNRPAQRKREPPVQRAGQAATINFVPVLLPPHRATANTRLDARNKFSRFAVTKINASTGHPPAPGADAKLNDGRSAVPQTRDRFTIRPPASASKYRALPSNPNVKAVPLAGPPSGD